MSVLFTVTVLMQFAPDVWTDISDDVVRPLRFQRGMQGNGPTDTIANTGTFEFQLRNDEENSEETLGLYSWGGPNCRPGFQEGAPVRLLISSGAYTDVPVWTGYLHKATPETGAYGTRRVHCIAQDIMGVLSDAEVLEVRRQISKTEVEVLDAILDSLPAEQQPAARDFDTPEHLFPVALDDIGSGESAWGVLEKVITSARGSLYPLGTGALRYRNFQSLVLEATRYTFTDDVLADLEIPSSTEEAYRRFTVITHPKTIHPDTGVSPDRQVLATHEGALAIDPGATVEIFLSYRDPDRPEVKVGGTDFEDPLLAMADYEFNSEEDGGGVDVTSDIAIVAGFFAGDVKLSIQNLGAVKAYRQRLQVRGRGIYDEQPATARAGTGYGTKPVEIDMPYQNDAVFAQAIADFLEASYRNLVDANRPQRAVFYPDEDAELMAQALTLEIGNVVTCNELVALPDDISAFIQSIAGEVDEHDHLQWAYGLAPRIVEDALHTDDNYIADRFLVSSAPPVSAIGSMLIGFSEIG